MIGPKIFGVGLNKTGTSSLAKALELLGLPTSHDDEANRLRCKSRSWPANFVAFLDGPIYRHQFQLAQQFPDALFIQTVRPRNEWTNSRLIHVLHNRVRDDGDQWTEANTATWEREFDEWEAQADEFRDVAGNRLLRWNLIADPDWSILCDFLDVPVPRVPFPHENTGNWRLRQILDAYEGNQPTRLPD